MAEFELRLHPRPFAKICAGVKTIEMRLNDEKRRGMAVGDMLTFISRETGERVRARVVRRLQYATFAELVARHDTAAMGYGPEWEERLKAGDHGMYEWYSRDEEREWGVVGLEIELLDVRAFGKMEMDDGV